MALRTRIQTRADLLRTEHAVVRVLASAGGEADAYPALLAAIGESLGCAGALAAADEDGELRCAETLAGGRGRRRELVARRVTAPRDGSGRVRVPAAPRSASWPSRRAPLEPDAALLATMDSLGSQISQFVERCRAQQAVRVTTRARARSSTPPSTASSRWTTTATWSRSTAPRSARSATGRGDDRPRAGRADRPAALRARTGAGRALPAHRATTVGGHPLELEGMRADGSEFPVEVVITRADLPGPPLFCGYLRDVTEAAARARPAAAGRRAGGAAARGDRGRGETDPRRVFAVVTEEVARLLGAQSSNMVRFDATARRPWSAAGASADPQRPGRRHGAMDGDTASARVFRTARRRGSTTTRTSTASWPRSLRGLGFLSAVAAPIFLDGRLWGAVIVSSVEPSRSRPAPSSGSPTSPSSPRRRWPTRSAREELAASRARIVAGRRRRAPAAGAQPPRRRAAAARLAGADAAAGRAPAPATTTISSRPARS